MLNGPDKFQSYIESEHLRNKNHFKVIVLISYRRKYITVELFHK